MTKKKKKKIAITVCSVVAIVGVVIAIICLTNKQEDIPVTTTQQTNGWEEVYDFEGTEKDFNTYEDVTLPAIMLE